MVPKHDRGEQVAGDISGLSEQIFKGMVRTLQAATLVNAPPDLLIRDSEFFVRQSAVYH